VLQPLRVGGEPVGWVGPQWAARLHEPGPFRADVIGVHLDDALDSNAARTRALARWTDDARSRYRIRGWRNERIEIQGRNGAPLLEIERALLRPLGLLLPTVQVNVFAADDRGAPTKIWVARRALHKPVDPGRLDTLVGGGIGAGETVSSTLRRECAEEAGIPAELSASAHARGTLESAYLFEQDGCTMLHRERARLFDLAVPAQFEPGAVDGEHSQILAMTPAQLQRSLVEDDWTREGAAAAADLLARCANAG